MIEFLTIYLEIGLVFGVLWTILVSLVKTELVLLEVIAVILLYPIVIYHIIIDTDPNE